MPAFRDLDDTTVNQLFDYLGTLEPPVGTAEKVPVKRMESKRAGGSVGDDVPAAGKISRFLVEVGALIQSRRRAAARQSNRRTAINKSRPNGFVARNES